MSEKMTSSATRKEWLGGDCPEHPYAQIWPTYRGPARATGVRITCAMAGRLDWSHDGSDDDIIAYSVGFDPALAAVNEKEG